VRVRDRYPSIVIYLYSGTGHTAVFYYYVHTDDGCLPGERVKNCIATSDSRRRRIQWARAAEIPCENDDDNDCCCSCNIEDEEEEEEEEKTQRENNEDRPPSFERVLMA